jgi:CspA family cold shock protein
VIARLFADKGFGFVQPTDDGQRFFFHRSALSGAEWHQLYEGQRVLFAEESSTRGPRAKSVVVEAPQHK